MPWSYQGLALSCWCWNNFQINVILFWNRPTLRRSLCWNDPLWEWGDNCYRADSRLEPSQWETSLQCNAVSHWLGANWESALLLYRNTWKYSPMGVSERQWPEQPPSISHELSGQAMTWLGLGLCRDSIDYSTERERLSWWLLVCWRHWGVPKWQPS